MTSSSPPEHFLIKQADADDTECIVNYFGQLSERTKMRFGPHAFNIETIHNILQDRNRYLVYVAMHLPVNELVAYAVIKKGSLEHDRDRLRTYGLHLNEQTDCTLAPSVADAWQNSGLGSLLHQYAVNDLRKAGFHRIILWGGVQADNHIAVRFYQKHRYRLLGEFLYHGKNYDMIRTIQDAPFDATSMVK